MIGFMPSIYPDELVYSWFCRYFVHAGYTSNKMALDDLLYNRHCNPSKEFIGHLNTETEQTIKKMYPIDKLVLEHTMFPQYARFIEASKKKDALYRLGHDFCDAHHLFSILPRADGDQYMKYCPLCASEDRERYGEAYWHRQHQIRNMGICVKHKCRLENSNISAKSDHIFVLDPAEDVLQDRIPVQVDNPHELDFASYVVDIFEAPMDFDNDVAVSSILYYGIENTKYMKLTGKTRNSRMLADEGREKVMENEECMITLDEIINIVLTGGVSGGEDPAFVRMCEKKVAKELLEYTDKIAKKSTGGKEEGGEDEETWMEDEC